MNQLMALKRKVAVIPSLEAEVGSLKDSLTRAEKRLAESEAQNSEVGTHLLACLVGILPVTCVANTQARTVSTNEARNLLTQLHEREQSLREAQEAELDARKKYQQLVDTGVPSKDEYREIEGKLNEEITAKKKVAAELEQARNQLMLLQHMGPPQRQSVPGVRAGNWSMLPEHGTHGYTAHGLMGIGPETPSDDDVDTILRELTKVPHASCVLYGLCRLVSA